MNMTLLNTRRHTHKDKLTGGLTGWYGHYININYELYSVRQLIVKGDEIMFHTLSQPTHCLYQLYCLRPRILANCLDPGVTTSYCLHAILNFAKGCLLIAVHLIMYNCFKCLLLSPFTVISFVLFTAVD